MCLAYHIRFWRVPVERSKSGITRAANCTVLSVGPYQFLERGSFRLREQDTSDQLRGRDALDCEMILLVAPPSRKRFPRPPKHEHSCGAHTSCTHGATRTQQAGKTYEWRTHLKYNTYSATGSVLLDRLKSFLMLYTGKSLLTRLAKQHHPQEYHFKGHCSCPWYILVHSSHLLPSPSRRFQRFKPAL